MDPIFWDFSTDQPLVLQYDFSLLYADGPGKVWGGVDELLLTMYSGLPLVVVGGGGGSVCL